MSRLRAAEVGTGPKGLQHMSILNEFEEVELVAVCDPADAARDEAGDRYNVSRRYSRVEDLLDGEELDAVFVATPPQLNAPVSQVCLEHGVHTFLEKPPGMKPDEAWALCAAAQKTGAKGMVGLNRRFHPMITRAREMVEERGPIVQLVGEFHKSMTMLGRSRLRYVPEVMDNWMMANDIHAVDLVRALAGAEVRELHSFGRRAFSEYRDLHAALVVFENDCVANFAFNYTTGYRLERYEIHGRDISVFLEGVKKGLIYRDGETSELPPSETGGTEEELRYFVDCLVEDRPVELPAANLEEGAKSVELVEAIRAGLRED